MTPLKFKVRESSIGKHITDDYFYISDGRGRYLHKDFSIQNTCKKDNFFETKEEAQTLLDEYFDQFKKELVFYRFENKEEYNSLIENLGREQFAYIPEFLYLDEGGFLYDKGNDIGSYWSSATVEEHIEYCEEEHKNNKIKIIYAKDLVKKEIKTEKNMQIKDKIICIDTQDSDSLEYGAEYIIVDINQHGNLGLKNPTTGSLLNHYYKPNRFKMAKREPIEVRLWVEIETNKISETPCWEKEGTKRNRYVAKLFREVTEG